jgi:adenine phosphoribosyltransferase
MLKSGSSSMDFRSFIRDVPDFPKAGILFRDITPLLGNGPAFRACITQMCERLSPYKPQIISGIESRGFIFGATMAVEMGIGFVPIRKPRKLPWKTRTETYALEYGTDAIEIHEDALAAGTRVALVDDLLATGGTAGAAIKLLQSLGGNVVATEFLIELAFLEGRKRLGQIPVEVLITY